MNKKIPDMIGKRISETSCEEHKFEKAKKDYNKALGKNGFSEEIKYYKRVRTRKVIWFNPPYSSHIKTNLGKVFMKLIVKHFPKYRVKLSYSCMQNMGNIITKHKNKLLFKALNNHPQCVTVFCVTQTVFCIFQKCFVYQTQVDSVNSRKYYLGTSEDEFKTGYNNHTMSLRKKRS